MITKQQNEKSYQAEAQEFLNSAYPGYKAYKVWGCLDWEASDKDSSVLLHAWVRDSSGKYVGEVRYSSSNWEYRTAEAIKNGGFGMLWD